MGNNRFVEQWVTPFIYNELLEEAVNVRVQCIDPEKNRLDALCIYCGKEYPYKLKFMDYYWKGCHVGPLVPSYKVKGEGLPLHSTLKIIALALVIAKHVESGVPLSIHN